MSVPLDLELLRTFVAVVESGSLSNAAPLVGRSQSAVSMQIQRLEQSVGRELLMRRPQAARPNAAGEELLAYARKMLRLSDAARAAIARPEEIGSVRLGVPEDYVAHFLPPVLAQFAAEHPLVAVELICEASRQLIPAVQNGRIDLAIVTRLPGETFPVQRREPLVWVASPNHVTWELDPLPIALFEAGCGPAHAHVLEALKGANRSYRVAYSSASLSGLIAVVEAGLAIAGLPRCSVPPSLRTIGGYDGLPSIRELEMSVLRSPASTPAATQCLYDFLQRELSRNL
ncbi:LysR substrate-binding domain-containing protein [Mesorhizobium sp. VK9D]|uniref:LysR substrate-binding domain-containing protein n=1 Tax=Mesorhizobium australafricanum TaxID=3072311 RepID=UPI002A240520|nr:LysR substrate-binding domain-containing protein [Mesorhizobium sp. VK9D]MDX8456805.1 LysR substrate-binding domain-containing protein [Mesorhizobium sp. VK9D]